MMYLAGPTSRDPVGSFTFHRNAFEPQSKLVQGGYTGDYIGDYYRGS